MITTAMVDDALTRSLAAGVRRRREHEGLSVAALAERSGVSRAMIAKIERTEAQPTAVLLARLARGLGLTLSELIVAAEHEQPRLMRGAQQSVWTDPETGYRRRTVSAPGTAPELAEIELPAGAEVRYPAGAYPVHPQQIYMLAGRLEVTEATGVTALARGDCLTLGPPGDRVYRARGSSACRYLVATERAR